MVLDTRDGIDGQLGPDATEADFAHFQGGLIHPLTGPIYVKGAQPGDVLEVEFLDILPQAQAFSAILPGFGFLRDVCTTPFLVHWHISDGWATSPQLPVCVSPGRRLWAFLRGPACATARLGSQGTGADLTVVGCFPPDPAGAVPGTGVAATEGLRTLPPRENGGNFDVKQLTKGCQTPAASRR